MNYSILENYEDVKTKVYNYIDKLKASNIFILKKGELEDYITGEGQKIIEDLGFANQKDLKIIKLAELINNGDVKNYICFYIRNSSMDSIVYKNNLIIFMRKYSI